jgi:hypothetical protein
MLRIARRLGDKIRLRGEINGTMTVILCTFEMRQFYGTSLIVRLESENGSQTFIPAYDDKWNKYGGVEIRKCEDEVIFVITSKRQDLQALRTEIIRCSQNDRIRG